MQVRFPPELEGKLNRIAAEQGKDSETLVCEAVERLVGHDEWFIREVEEGVAAADRMSSGDEGCNPGSHPHL